MFAYECIKRSCRHVKGLVVPVVVWWIMGPHRCRMHISVNIYCTSTEWSWLSKDLHKTMLGRPQRLELNQTDQTNTKAPNETSAASKPLSSIDTTSFSFYYSSAATTQYIFCSFDKLKLNSNKAPSYYPLNTHSSAPWKMAAFPMTIAKTGWAMSSWPLWKVTQTPG